MAWTAPMTAVANTEFTAAQFNTHVRDNLLETAPAKATTAGGYFVATAANQIVERVVGSASVNTEENTTSTSFVDLTTVGPTVSIATGTSALVFMTAECRNTSISGGAQVGLDITGATTQAPDTNNLLRFDTEGTNNYNRATATRHITGLNAGTNVFKMMYKSATASTQSNFNFRHLVVMPL